MRKETRNIMKYFYGFVGREKPQFFVYLTLTIIFMSIQPFANIIIPKFLIEELLGATRQNVLLFLIVVMILSNWICNSLISIFNLKLESLSWWFSQYFDKLFAHKNMTMDFEHTEDPEVLNQAKKAEDGMGWYSFGVFGLTKCFNIIVSSVITLIGVVIIITSASPYLFVIAVIAVILSSFVVSRINKLEIVSFNKGPIINRGFWYILDVLCETRFGKDIRLYNAEKMLNRKSRKSFLDLYLMFKELEDGKRKWGCVNALISVFESIAIYLYLGFLLVLARITIGDFTMLITAALTFRTSLQNIITELQDLEKRANFMNEYKVFMEYKDSMVSGNKKTDGLIDIKIEFKNVSFKYPRTNDYILKDVNLTIRSKEHLSIVGLNGAGKTTFIKLLCRLYDVNEGEILINGVNIKEYDYSEYMKLLSVVFQDFKLFNMSLKENIQTGNWQKATDQIEKECELVGLKEKIADLTNGLETQIYKQFKEEGIEPSGGEAQKIAIARAIHKDAPIIILDEPTAALDPIAEYEIYKHFDQLVGNKTAVYISHRLSSCKFCDQIAVFADKTIAEYGTHDELVSIPDGIYATMFQAQAQYYQ